MAQNTTLTLDDLKLKLGPEDRLLGLDLGTKTIGLALSDVRRVIATPMQTIQRTKFKQDAELLLDLIQKHQITGLIIGFPVNFDGSEGPRAQSTRAFCRNFSLLSTIDMVLWDERLSTVAAERVLLEADTSRKKRAEVIDKMAAAYILQGALDRLSML